MGRLKTLKPRLQSVGSRLTQVARVETQRITGSRLQTIRHRILTRDGGMCRCEMCKRTDDVRKATEVEHRVPLWAQGQEDDANRYAINTDCHKAKTDCEARMRAAGGWMATACTCGRHAP